MGFDFQKRRSANRIERFAATVTCSPRSSDLVKHMPHLCIQFIAVSQAAADGVLGRLVKVLPVIPHHVRQDA
jgi:hypothetical protein